jgi:Leucine-rich repeat (LRR) protein
MKRMIHGLIIVIVGLVFMGCPSPGSSPSDSGTTETSTLEISDVPDANLRTVFEVATGKSFSEITETDLASLDHLEIDGGVNNVSNLTGIEMLSNLETLNIHDTDISDISLLSNLTKLTSLRVESNNITDISSLQNLTGLTYLNARDNSISNISSINTLTNLTCLDIPQNNISDISSLAGLTNLTSLFLWSNQISSAAPIKNLTELTVLKIDGNNLSDISDLVLLSKLTILGLAWNDITDLSPLETLYTNGGLNTQGSEDIDLNLTYNNLNLLTGSANRTIVNDLINHGVRVEYEEGNTADSTSATSLGETLTLSGTITQVLDTNTGTISYTYTHGGTDYVLQDGTNSNIYDTDTGTGAEISLSYGPADAGDCSLITSWGLSTTNTNAKLGQAEVRHVDNDDQVFYGNFSNVPSLWYEYYYLTEATTISGTIYDNNYNDLELYAGWNRVVASTPDGGVTITHSGGTISGATWVVMDDNP